MSRPALWRVIDVPEPFCTISTIDRTIPYAGDVRLGSLSAPGSVDFLVYRSVDASHDDRADTGMKPVFIGAFDIDGNPLWSVGEGGLQPSRPGPVAIHDIDGDGESEVVCFFKREDVDAPPDSLADVELRILDGTTGALKRRSAPSELTACAGSGPNWVHQRILLADFRGLGSPRDFVVKLGTVVLAFDEHFDCLWRYESPWSDYGHCPAYIPSVGDIDGDGRDEVNGGYFLLDHDGAVLWERDWAPHMDSVAITAWDGGRMRAVCSGGGHVIDASGNIILSLGESIVPHGQEVRVARFREGDPEPQMAIRWNGHHTDVILVDTAGEIVSRFNVNESPNNTGMEAIYWEGMDRPALLYSGGMLWDPVTGEGTRLPGLPEPNPVGRMAWYHAIAADVSGDDREELVLYNPWDPRVFIFGQAGKSIETGRYHPGPRQYNARLMD